MVCAEPWFSLLYIIAKCLKSICSAQISGHTVGLTPAYVCRSLLIQFPENWDTVFSSSAPIGWDLVPVLVKYFAGFFSFGQI
mmetsp:Transcript_12234/g.20242  ORF Transcript_12234/g.20242 Transcript_12234/m.20242 type:complete len:82 (+) Transcript_12234:1177-1422(+)